MALALNRWLRNRSVLIGTIIVAAVLIVGISVFSLLATRAFTQSAKMADVARRTAIQHQRFNLKMEEAIGAQRAYIASGDPKFLKEWQVAQGQLLAMAEPLLYIAGDNAVLVSASKEIKRPLGIWAGELQQQIGLRQSAGAEAAIQRMTTDAGKGAVDEIRQRLAQVEKESQRLADSASRQSGWTLFRLQVLGVVFIWLDLLMLTVGGYYLMTRLSDLEKIITVCAWTKRVKHEGVWLTFEDYMSKRFGIKISHGMSEEAAVQWAAESKVELQKLQDLPRQSSS